MSSPTGLRSRSLWSNNKWQLAKTPNPQKTHLCISRSYYLCLHRSVCKITLSHLVQSRWGFCKPFVVHLLVHLRSASSTAVSANQILRQTDAGRRMIRCCLTSAQCGTRVFGVGLIARFWTRSRSAQHSGPQSCSGPCLFAHYRVIEIGSVTLRCVAFCTCARLFWEFLVQIKAVFFRRWFTGLGGVWTAFMECCRAGQWLHGWLW